MLADHTFVDDLLALFGAILVFIPAFIIAINQTRKVGGKVDRAAEKADKAVVKAETAAAAASVVAERTETGNGRSLGETVHDTAQTVELVEAMMHTNTKEILSVANKLEEHIADSLEYRREARIVHDKLFEELDKINGKEG